MLPYNQKAIGYKRVFKIKYNPNSSIKRYKTRLVIQKFFQLHGIDYIKIFAPTIKYELLKIFLAITVILGMILIQMDIIEAYLESVLG